MKIIDEKGRLFKIINIVDLAILLALVLIVAGVVYQVRKSRLEQTMTPDQFLVTVLCPMVPPAVPENLMAGDQIVFGNVFVNGFVVSVSATPARMESVDAQGNFTVTHHPWYMDAIVEIRVENDPRSRLIMLGKYQVNIGKEFVVKTSRVEVNGVVLNIKEYTE